MTSGSSRKTNTNPKNSDPKSEAEIQPSASSVQTAPSVISPVAFQTDASSSANEKLAAAASELGNDLEQSADNRGEERFIWIVVCLILFDCLIFMHMESWSGPIIIGIIELVLIIALAKKLRVEEIAKLLTRFMDRVADYPDGKGK